MEILVQQNPLSGEYIISYPTGEHEQVASKAAVRRAVAAYKLRRGHSDRLDGRWTICWE